MFKLYTKKDVIRSIAGLLGMMVLLKATGGAGFVVVFLLLTATALQGKADKLLYLFLMTVAMTLCNPFLVPKGGVYSITLRMINLSLGFLMMTKLAGQRTSPIVKPFLFLYLYLGVQALTSQTGWCPTISEMKLLLFSLIFIGYCGVTNSAINASLQMESKIRSVLLAFAAFFIIGSFLVIPIPAISIMNPYELEEVPLSLFQGITSHSQCLGPCIAILTTMVFADLLYNIRRPDRFYLAMLFCAPVLLYKTASRTAMGSCLCGIALASYFFVKMRGVSPRWRGKVRSALGLLFLLGFVAAIAVPNVRRAAKRFILKFDADSNAEVSFASVTSTRAGKWETAMENFHESPFVGNGFQVSERMKGITASQAFRYLSAPVEKGVWISAILEEGGVLGIFIFVSFIIVVSSTLYRRKAYTGLSTFLVLIISNMGEFTVFSMTYTGGLQWAVVFCSLVLDAQRLRSERERKMMPAWEWRWR